MPKIPQHYLDCSIYLYDTKESAESGENFGGSGCLVSVTSNPLYDQTSFERGRYTKVSIFFPPHIYAVTNKHVVEQGYSVIRLNTVDDQMHIIELEESDWRPHPEGDDLSVAPIRLPKTRHGYSAIDTQIFVNRESMTMGYPYSSAIGAGDDTFMVGRFISHAGTQRNTPSLRFGSIAMLPFEKVKLQGGHMQEAFLVETRSMSGYSGSPVFVYRPVVATAIPYTGYYNPNADFSVPAITDLVGRPALLGIDCGHVINYDKVLDASGRPHEYGFKVASNTGMAIVIPAWRLNDLLNIEELVKQRQEKDRRFQEEKEAEKQSGSVAPDVEKPDSSTAEDYQDVLKRASQKISHPESGSNET